MTEEEYIKLALKEAEKGKGNVSPNPLVGAVIVKNDKVIGKGHHEYFGGPHAEINAINNSKQSIEGATIYVTLEPCNHFGKTPPCTDAIIKNKFNKVVIGTLDPNPIVAGTGITKLKGAGVEVVTGILENECKELNRFFLKFIQKKIPYVTLKAAQTLDGKIADIHNDSKWISSHSSRAYVHKLRSEYDAVMVGTSTVIADDPQLNVRLAEGRDPKIIVTDSNLKLNLSHKIFVNNKNEVFLITSEKSKIHTEKLKQLEKLNVKIIFVDLLNDKLNLETAFRKLAEHNIGSILVEGGSGIFTSVVRNNLFDEMLLFIAPKLLGTGIPLIDKLNSTRISNAVNLKLNKVEIFENDVMLQLFNKSN